MSDALPVSPSPDPSPEASSISESSTQEAFREEIGGGIGATHCPIKRPFRSWGDYQSHASLCERLGRNIAVCEMPQVGQTPAEICREQDETGDRAVVVEAECLQWQVDPQTVPGMIENLLRCTRGPRFNEGHYQSIPCETQLACVRATGLEWTAGGDETRVSSMPSGQGHAHSIQ